MSNAYSFAPEERPAFAGSPYTPSHPVRRRLAYAAVAILVGICSTFSNALVTVNVPNLAGSFGLFAVEASLLPAIYVAMNATANLTLVKARAQFGIPAVTRGLLIAYAATALLQFLWPSFATAIVVRAVCGMTAAALTTITIYYLMQVFPGRLRPLALVIGIGLPQLGTPFARLIPVDLLVAAQGRGLSLLETGVALAVLAAISAAPLPPSDRSKAFEKLDLVTIALVVPAMLLTCAVLGEGRLLWWSDTPWLGWAAAGAIPLFAAAFLIEHYRAHPLLRTRWLGSADILRFAVVAAFVRIALAEQTYGAVGLLTSGGLNNDQLRLLFAIVAAAMVLGIVVAALTLSERRLPYQVAAAALIIALGAWLDSDASNVTRPPQLYLSQALIGFGTTLFIGPALVYGILRMLAKGGDYLVSFIVLFSITQNVGGLAGSALLGTYQVASARAHAAALSEHLAAADPVVAARLARGVGPLWRALLNEANILAFNDVFRLVAIIALATAFYVAFLIVLYARRRRQTEAMVTP